MVKQTKQQTPTKTAPIEEQRNEAATATKEKASVPAKQESTELTEADAMAALLAEQKAAVGGGLSSDQADNLIPFIYVLQPLSPQVMKGDAARIPDAEAGDIWLRNGPVIKGEDGMLFQPCFHYKDIVEWIPDRGGFVGRHDISCLPNVELKKGWTGTLSDVKEVKDDEDPNAPPRYVRSSNNNEVVETRYYVGYVLVPGLPPMPYVIPLASSGHTFGKGFMTMQRQQVLADGSPSLCSWNFFYRLRTTMKTNKKGSWYTYTAMMERGVKSLDEFYRGKALNESFAAGEKKLDDTQMDRGAASGAGASSDGELSNDE